MQATKEKIGGKKRRNDFEKRNKKRDGFHNREEIKTKKRKKDNYVVEFGKEGKTKRTTENIRLFFLFSTVHFSKNKTKNIL